MTKTEAIAKAGTAYQLAKILGIKPQSISNWGDNVPALQVYRLKELRPEWFRNKESA